MITIPEKKLSSALNKLKSECQFCKNKDTGSNLCDRCSVLTTAFNRYAMANIPVDYWYLDMDKFNGEKILLQSYHLIADDITKSYDDGASYCFAGGHGIGKSMVSTNILKRAVEKGYSALYTNLTDIVTILTSYNYEEKRDTRQALLTVDFLVIDEFDPRFMGSDNASDLYGRILEPTLRHRIQNKLPIFFCSNSPNVTASFHGSLKSSISSLMNMVKPVMVLGQDYRKGIK